MTFRFRHGVSLRATIAVVAALLAGAGCTPGERGKTEIRFWAFGSEGENVRRLLPAFEQRHPDISVAVQVIPWTAAHEKLLTAFAGRSTPDICQLGNTWIPEFVVLGAIEPLDPWLATTGTIRKESYFEGIWNTNIVDSAVYGIPWYVDTRVVYYRMDIFTAAGYREFPKTWDEWEEASRKIVALSPGKESYGIFMPTNEWAPTVIFGLQAGSRLLRDRDCYGDFSGPEFTRAFTFTIGLFHQRLALGSITRVNNLYQAISEGYVASYITGPWNIGEFRRRLPARLQGSWMTAPLPGPDSTHPGVSLAGGSSLVMFTGSRHKEAVWKLIEFLSEQEQQLDFYRITGDLPARREAWEDTTLTANPYARAFYVQLNHVVATPKIPQWEQIAMKVQDYAEVASRGTLSVPDALKALDRDVDRILEKRRWVLHVGE